LSSKDTVPASWLCVEQRWRDEAPVDEGWVLRGPRGRYEHEVATR